MFGGSGIPSRAERSSFQLYVRCRRCGYFGEQSEWPEECPARCGAGEDELIPEDQDDQRD